MKKFQIRLSLSDEMKMHGITILHMRLYDVLFNQIAQLNINHQKNQFLFVRNKFQNQKHLRRWWSVLIIKFIVLYFHETEYRLPTQKSFET